MYIPVLATTFNFVTGHFFSLCRDETDVLTSRRDFWWGLGYDATFVMFAAAALATVKQFRPDLVQRIPISKINSIRLAVGSLAMMPISDVAQQVYEARLS